MNETIRTPEPVVLWPDGAPLALGKTVEEQPALTPFLPAANTPTAAVIVCPGGAYSHRAPHEGEPVARWLASLGVAAFVVSYRVAPYQHSAALLDAQRAIRMVRARAEQWNIDPARVGILGFSAGGHLATCAATFFDAGNAAAADPIDRHGSRPDALIACYPVIDLGPFSHAPSIKRLLGETPAPALLHKLSLQNSVTANNPPAFIWTTAEDASVPVQNVLLLATALRQQGVPFELHVFPHGRHGLGLAEGLDAHRWTGQAAQWLAQIGFR